MASSPDFESVVAAYYEPLYQFAFSLTRTEADARDLTQQTFYVWAIKGHQLRDESKVKTWLFTTLRRAFLAGRRKETRYTFHDWEEVSDESTTVSPVQADQADSAQVLLALAKVDQAYQAAVA